MTVVKNAAKGCKSTPWRFRETSVQRRFGPLPFGHSPLAQMGMTRQVEGEMLQQPRQRVGDKRAAAARGIDERKPAKPLRRGTVLRQVEH